MARTTLFRISLAALAAALLPACATGPVVSFGVHAPEHARALVEPGRRIEVLLAGERRRRRFDVVAEDAEGFVSSRGVRIGFTDVREVTLLPGRLSAAEIAAALVALPFLIPCTASQGDCFR